MSRRPDMQEQVNVLPREYYAFCLDHIAPALQSGAFRLGNSGWPHWHF